MCRSFITTTVIAGALVASLASGAAAMSDQELLATLNGAAPQDVLDHATILNKEADGTMKVVREGDNGWICMDPNRAPMCADKAAMDWAHAWQGKGPASLLRSWGSSTC
jgi:hypothetical protein